MEQLLKITNVPIALELKVNHARLEYKNASADLEIHRDTGGLQIKSSPIRLNIDTFEARDSIAPASTYSGLKRAAQRGKEAVYQATATMAQEGHLMLKAKIGEDVLGQIIASHSGQYFEPAQAGIDFIPSTGADLTWSEPNVTIDYQMDKLNFDWKIQKGDFEFIPGDIEISITQYPDVLIEYVGSPLYVPPSADPNYVPIDVKA